MFLKTELEKSSIKDISRRRRLSYKSPPIMIPLLEPLGYDGMNDFGDEILPGTETGQDRQKSIHKDLYKAIEISDWEIT